MLLEIIAEFDPIAAHGYTGSGKTSYFSFTICDEFISKLVSKTRDKISTNLKNDRTILLYLTRLLIQVMLMNYTDT